MIALRYTHTNMPIIINSKNVLAQKAWNEKI
jgi:hypothetical protein